MAKTLRGQWDELDREYYANHSDELPQLPQAQPTQPLRGSRIGEGLSTEKVGEGLWQRGDSFYFDYDPDKVVRNGPPEKISISADIPGGAPAQSAGLQKWREEWRQYGVQQLRDQGLSEKEIALNLANWERQEALQAREGDLNLSPRARSIITQLEDQVYQVEMDDRVRPEEREALVKALLDRKFQVQLADRLRVAEPTREEKVRNVLGSNYEKYKDLPWTLNDKGELMLPRGFSMPKEPEMISFPDGKQMLKSQYDVLNDKYKIDLKRQEQWDKQVTSIELNAPEGEDGKPINISQEEIEKRIGPRPDAVHPLDMSGVSQGINAGIQGVGSIIKGVEKPPDINIPKATTKIEYDALPAGALYMDETGNIWRKK